MCVCLTMCDFVCVCVSVCVTICYFLHLRKFLKNKPFCNLLDFRCFFFQIFSIFRKAHLCALMHAIWGYRGHNRNSCYHTVCAVQYNLSASAQYNFTRNWNICTSSEKLASFPHWESCKWALYWNIQIFFANHAHRYSSSSSSAKLVALVVRSFWDTFSAAPFCVIWAPTYPRFCHRSRFPNLKSRFTSVEKWILHNMIKCLLHTHTHNTVHVVVVVLSNCVIALFTSHTNVSYSYEI